MNKYLMMTAAALLASTGGANAGQQQFTFGTSGGQPYCDGGTGAWSGNIYIWEHLNADCNGRNYVGGPGIEGRTRGIGRNVNMFDTFSIANNSGFLCSYDFPRKFKIGGPWSLWCSFSGSFPSELNSGVLLSSQPKPPAATKSSLSAVKAIVAERRSRKSQTAP